VKMTDGRNTKGSWKAKRNPLSIKPLDKEQ